MLTQAFSTTNRRMKVMLIDKPEFSNIMCYLLEASLKYSVRGQHTSMESAMPQIKKIRPAIIITEIDLEGMNGIEGVREIRRIYPSVQIMICSNLLNVDLVTQAFIAGSIGYLVKEECQGRFVEFLDEAVRGGSPISPSAARLLVESYQRNPISPLTFRETDIVELISHAHTYTEMADILKISKETVKSHLRNIYKKLGVNSKSQALKLVRDEKLI